MFDNIIYIYIYIHYTNIIYIYMMDVYIYIWMYIYIYSSYTQYIYIYILCVLIVYGLICFIASEKWSILKVVWSSFPVSVSCFCMACLSLPPESQASDASECRETNKQCGMWFWELALGYSTMVLASTTFERSEAEYLWIPILLVEYGSMKQMFFNHTDKTPHGNTCRLSLQGSTPS